MTKGAYDVNETNVGPTKDGSFRSMLCAMLVFVSICGIILIVAWPWRNASDNGKSSSVNYQGSADSRTGSQYNNSHTTTGTPVTNPEKQPKTTSTQNPNEFTNEPTKKPADIDFEFVTKSAFDPSGTTKQSEKIRVSPDNQPTEPVPVTTKESVTVTETKETTTVSVTADLSNRFNPLDKTTTQKINTPSTVTTATEVIYTKQGYQITTEDATAKATTNSFVTQPLDSSTTTDSSRGATTNNLVSSGITTTDNAVEQSTIVAESTTNNLVSESSGSNNTPTTTDTAEQSTIVAESTTINLGTEISENINDITTTDDSKSSEFITGQNTTPNPSDSDVTEATIRDSAIEISSSTDGSYKNLIDASTTPGNSKAFGQNTTPNPSDLTTEDTTPDSSTELSSSTDKSLIGSSTTPDNLKVFGQNTTPNLSDLTTEDTTSDSSAELSSSTDNGLIDSSTTPDNSKVSVDGQKTTANPSDLTTEDTTPDSSTELSSSTDNGLIDSSTTPDNSKVSVDGQKTTPNPSDLTTEDTTPDSSTELSSSTDNGLIDSSTTTDNSKVSVDGQNTTPNPSDLTTEDTTSDSSTELSSSTDNGLIDSSTTPDNSKVSVDGQKTTPNLSDLTTEDTTPDSSTELSSSTDKNLIDSSTTPKNLLDSSTTPENSKQSTAAQNTTPNPPNLDTEATTHEPSTEAPEKSTTIESTYRELTPSKKGDTTIPAIMETSGVDHTFSSTEPPKPAIPNIDECNAECRKVGARILSRMNHLADPCEQFYDYACGGDNNDNAAQDNWRRIAEGLDAIHEKSPDVYKTFKTFYESCVDFHTDYDYEQRIAEAKEILASVGQPYKDSVDEKSALTDLLTRLLQLDSSPLFDISVDVDKESQHFIFQLNIGKHFSTLQNDNTILSTKRKCINKSKKHFDYSISFFNFLNLNEMYTAYVNCLQNETYNAETVEKALEIFDLYDDLEPSIGHIEEILMKFKELPSAARIRKDFIMKKFDIRKVADLKYHYPLIDWKKILTNLVGKEIHDEYLVQVYFKDFFFKLFSRQQTLTTQELHDAILTMYIHDLYTKFVLPTQMSNPEEFCLHQSSDLMKEVASSLYLESIKSQDIEGDLKRVNDLFDTMKTKLQEIIQNDAQWVNVSPRISLTKKINKMELDTAWNKAPLWKDTALIQERMKSINGKYGNYSDFATALVRRNRDMLYSMWNTMGYEENNVWWYFLTPYSNNPASIYALNKIAIPPAMLFTKSKDIPRYLSLAKLGYSLAKAVSYHFDYTGSKYAMSLDRKAEQAYDETKTCTILSYLKKLEVEHDGKKVQFQINNDSLDLSLNERFAEDMTINLLSAISNEAVTDYQISWVASNPELTKQFSREKLFFIALGQEHCRKPNLEDYFLHLFESEHLPPSLFLDTALSHSELFKDVFYCKEGSRLDAMYKCSAFPEMQDVEEDYA